MSRFHGIAIAAGLGLLAGCAAPSKDMLEAHLGTSIPTLKPICAGSISPKGDPDRCEPSVGTRPWTAAKREFPFTLDVATARKEALESTGSAATEDPSEKAFGERLAQRIANAYLLKSFTADSGVDFACAGTTSALPPTLPQQFAHNSVSIRKVASEKLEVELSAAIESSSKALNLAISGETKLKLAAELSRRLEASSTTKGRLYWFTLTFSGPMPPKADAKEYAPCYERAAAGGSLIAGVSGFALLEYDASSDWLSSSDVRASLEVAGVTDTAVLQLSAKLTSSIRKSVQESGSLKVFSTSSPMFVPTFFVFQKP